MRSPVRLAATVLFVASAAATAAASDYVVFTDGRYMKVVSYWFEPAGSVHVVLAGGGQMAFAASRVRYVAPAGDVEEAPEPVAVVADAAVVATVAWQSFADPRFVDSIARLSAHHAVDPALVAAVVKVESDFRPHAVSPKGAKGLMQLMPLTARDLAVGDPFDAEANLSGGITYLRQLLTRYEGEESLALAAYNAGPTAVDRARGIPPYKETQSYVRKVLLLAGRTVEPPPERIE